MAPAGSAAAGAQGVGRPALNGNFRSVPTALIRSKGLRAVQSLAGAAGVIDSVTVTESVTPGPCMEVSENLWLPPAARPSEISGGRAQHWHRSSADLFSPERGRTPARLFPAPETTSYAGGMVSSNLRTPPVPHRGYLAPTICRAESRRTYRADLVAHSWLSFEPRIGKHQRIAWAEYLAVVTLGSRPHSSCEVGSVLSQPPLRHQR